MNHNNVNLHKKNIKIITMLSFHLVLFYKNKNFYLKNLFIKTLNFIGSQLTQLFSCIGMRKNHDDNTRNKL